LVRRRKSYAFALYHADRQLDKALIARLGTCNYIEDRRNIILLGASGCGKTWLACAFGNAACRAYYNVRYHSPRKPC
jgi:DNA replication protein DnaC